MDRIRAAGVPVWVSVFALVIAAMGLVFGIVALISPSSIFFTDADDALGQRWAGRQLGIGIVTLGALVLRSRPVYVLALLAGIAREIGDLFAAITEDFTTVPAIAFTVIGIAALVHISRTPVTEPAGAHDGPQLASGQHAR